jgi:uncharacterized protein (TIGR00730 family)
MPTEDQDHKATDPSPISDAWADVQTHIQTHVDTGEPFEPDSRRLAFVDPEFLLRRETRGIRFQLELLKPDLELQAAGVHGTVAIFGSARCVAPEAARQQLAQARLSGDAQVLARAERAMRTSRYYAAAREFAQIVARRNLDRPAADRLTICTGGGPGIMEAANRGAHDAGVSSVGLGIALPREQQFNPYVTPHLSFKFHYFALRKMHFMMRARALVVFPGGFGTLDELFSALTLVQTRKARPMPIVLFGAGHWQRLLHPDLLVQEGAIAPEDLDLMTYADTPREAWDAITAWYEAKIV